VQRENAKLKEQIKEIMESLSLISTKEFDDMSVKDLKAMH
jgi:hypothetical protein